MTSLQNLLRTAVENGRVPGPAALVTHGDDTEIAPGRL